MKVVNLGDPFTKRLTLRLTEIQYEHIVKMAADLDTSPSDYIRYLIMQSALRYDPELVLNAGNAGGTSDENVKADSDNNI